MSPLRSVQFVVLDDKGCIVKRGRWLHVTPDELSVYIKAFKESGVSYMLVNGKQPTTNTKEKT